MAYEPTNWKDGDLVTSAKLNKLEQGVANGGGIQVIHIIDDGENPPTLDKTWQEIHDGGFGVITSEEDNTVLYCPIIYIYNFGIITLAYTGPGTFDPVIFTAESADDYPSIKHNGGGR